MNPEIRNCQNCKNSFTIEPDDFAFYDKMKVPPPTFCPECRLQHRLATYNERSLYRSNCNNCSKKIITIYKPESGFKPFCESCFSPDNFDSIDQGRDFDFSRDFFTQYSELQKSVPVNYRAHLNDLNSEFSNQCFRSKNAYLSFSVIGVEDIMYSKLVNRPSRQIIDSLNVRECEICYETVNTTGSYGSTFLTNSRLCVDSHFLIDCVGCTNCFMSSNLRNKSYVFRNKQLLKEEYQKEIDKLEKSKYSVQVKLIEEFTKLSENAICKYAQIIQSDGCTGNMIENSHNSKNIFSSFSVINSKNIIFSTKPISDSYDVTIIGGTGECLELIASGRGNNKVNFTSGAGASKDMEYTDWCNDCQDIFGCVGLRNKKYCIFNKQYTKEEYFNLRKKIIEHMNSNPYVNKNGVPYKYGSFFPIEFSPFAYNETVAYEEFPMTKEQVESSGFSWYEQKQKEHVSTINASDLPDTLPEDLEHLCNEVVACPNMGDSKTMCTSAFKFNKDEFMYYKRLKVPLPRHCPNCRYYKRRSRTLPFKLWHRQCMCDLPNHTHEGKCQVEFETSYAPDRPEIVYCEKCYQSEVI